MTQYITTTETARLCRVTTRTLARWQERKENPFPASTNVIPGPQKHFVLSEVMAWMQENYPAAASEIIKQQKVVAA